MTDKQIIIDGYDVSECLFYQSNFEEDYDVKIKHFCSNWHNSCESANNSNCYFKQLARKTQECEQLKEKYEALKLENQEGYEIVDELKHEYEELENKIKKLRKNLALEIEASDRYRKALKEIEEVIDSIFDRCPWRKTDSCMPVYNVCEELIKTLDIINKAKGEE